MKNNRIAICLYGLPRGNKNIWERLLKVSEHYNADIFIHSWTKPKGQKNHMGLKLNSGLNYSGVFNFFQGVERLKAIQFTEQKLNKPEFLETEFGVISFSNQINSVKSMIFSRDLALSYSNSNNFQYSHFIFTRFDCDVNIERLNLIKFSYDFFHCGFINNETKKWEWEDVFFVVKNDHISFLDEAFEKMKSLFFVKNNIRNIFIHLFEVKKLSVGNCSLKVIKIFRKKNLEYVIYSIRYRLKKYW